MISRGFFIFSSFFFHFLVSSTFFREFLYPRRNEEKMVISREFFIFSSFFSFPGFFHLFFVNFFIHEEKLMIPRGFFIFSFFFREDILTENTMTQRKIK